MSIKNRVSAYLGMKTPEKICDACIERALGYDFKTVNPINRKFSEQGIVTRGKGIYQICGKAKLVNYRIYKTK